MRIYPRVQYVDSDISWTSNIYLREFTIPHWTQKCTTETVKQWYQAEKQHNSYFQCSLELVKHSVVGSGVRRLENLAQNTLFLPGGRRVVMIRLVIY